MREIKFRAWNKIEKMMEYDPYIGCSEERVYINKNVFNSDLYVYMQYVGTKDKNGKYIYEGDIIDSENPHVCGIVEYEEFCYWERELYLTGNELTVIGNIYENNE